MPFGALDGVNHQALAGMFIADIMLALVAPIRFVKRNLVAARSALHLFVAHNDLRPENHARRQKPSARQTLYFENRTVLYHLDGGS